MNDRFSARRRPSDDELWARCASVDPAVRAEALRELAARAARTGRTAAAIDLLEAAIASFELAGDELPRGLALVALADTLTAAGRVDDAVDSAWAALALLDRVGGDRHIADAYWMLARALRAALEPLLAAAAAGVHAVPSPVDVHAVPSPVDVHAVPSPVDVHAVPSPVDVHAVPSPFGVHAAPSPAGVHAAPSPFGVHAAPSPAGGDDVDGHAIDGHAVDGGDVDRGDAEVDRGDVGEGDVDRGDADVLSSVLELAEVAERAAGAAEVAGVALVPGRARLMRAEVLLAAGLSADAVHAFRAAAASARDGRDPLTAADCRLGVARALLAVGRAAEAWEEVRDLPDVYTYLHCDDLAAAACEVQAGVHTALGHELAARECLALAAELYAQAGDVATAAAADWQWARRVLDSASVGEAQRVDAEEVARSSAAVLALLGAR
jgi:tetratricopeptide (TPR) repeat protein